MRGVGVKNDNTRRNNTRRNNTRSDRPKRNIKQWLNETKVQPVQIIKQL